MDPQSPLQIAVIGSGAAGLSAAWLLAQPGYTRARHNSSEPSHQITLIEKDDRLGGHAHTASVNCHKNSNRANKATMDDKIGVDTGFIVYNTLNYPNFTAWLDKLQIATQPTEMSFAVSLNGGDYEYKGGDLTGLFAQPSNVFKPRFWRMLSDLVRFYRTASGNSSPPTHITLGDYLEQGKYRPDFVNDHLLPFGAAIWSTSQEKMLDYPAAAFIRFCDNHGLLSLADRPEWRSVTGGSESYVEAVRAELQDHTVITSRKVTRIYRTDTGVVVEDRSGNQSLFDHVV